MFQSNIRLDSTFLINIWPVYLRIIWPNPSYAPDLSHVWTLPSILPTAQTPSHNLICRLYIKWPVLAQLILLFYELFVCKCVPYYCHRLSTQLQLKICHIDSLLTARCEDRIPVGLNFPQTSRPALWPTQPPVIWVLLIFPVVKGTGVWRWPLIPIYRWGKRKNRAVYLLPLCPFMACSKVKFVFAVYKRLVHEVFYT